MDFLILALVLGLAGHQIYLHRFVKRELKKLHVTLISQRASQGRMRKLAQSSTESPPIIDRARTTRRDTDDLPTTGRMGSLLPRGGGENAGIDHDGKLPESL